MSHDGDPDQAFGPDTYGRSFADVYDEWYPADAATSAAVERIHRLAGDGARILELGVGTGRLALPLAALGHEVVGLDSSVEMLDRLAANAAAGAAPAEVSGGSVEGVQGDVAEPASWPAGPFQVVVAAFNLVCNLADAAAQAAMFAQAHAALAPGGVLVVEAFVPHPVDTAERRLEVREVSAEQVVLIASRTDPDLGVVIGQHIQLRDGEPVRLRPWRLRPTSPAELDRLAAEAGLDRVDRRDGWDGAGLGDACVTTFRRPMATDRSRPTDP
jgi:SAM-dependent methyltransferase